MWRCFLTAVRPNELSKLEVNQITSCVVGRIKVFMIKHKIGAIYRTSKNAHEGIMMIQNTPTETPIFDENNLDDMVNVYQDMENYMKVRDAIELPKSIKMRFFLGINGVASRFEKYRQGCCRFKSSDTQTCARGC